MSIITAIIPATNQKGCRMTLQETLAFYNINTIWHFTDRSNLPSIKEHGLLSLCLIEQYGIDVSCYGANAISHELDRRYGLDKYIHLSFIKDHPMCYCKTLSGEMPNPVWLMIDVSVLFSEQTRFATEVANKTGTMNYEINELDQRADLEVLWGRTDWRDAGIQSRRKSAKKGELLIPNRIKPEQILNLGAA